MRARGVMEKCTYCVQRIADARIDADKATARSPTARCDRLPGRLPDAGDHLRRPERHGGSAVAAARADARNYALLRRAERQPRTTYLADARRAGREAA